VNDIKKNERLKIKGLNREGEKKEKRVEIGR
jgi:hypothetical protein